jgi:hypothetical protein
MKNVLIFLFISLLINSAVIAANDLSIAREHGVDKVVKSILNSEAIAKIINQKTYGDGQIEKITKDQSSNNSFVVHFSKFSGEAISKCEMNVISENSLGMKLSIFSPTCEISAFTVWSKN